MKAIIVVGNTREEAEEWAKENVTHPHIAAGRDETVNLKGTRLLAVVYTPEVRSVTYELYKQLHRLEVIFGVNKNTMVEH